MTIKGQFILENLLWPFISPSKNRVKNPPSIFLLLISNQTFKKSFVCLLFSQILELYRELRTHFHGAAPSPAPFTHCVRTSSQCLNYKEARRGFDCYVNPPYLTHMSIEHVWPGIWSMRLLRSRSPSNISSSWSTDRSATCNFHTSTILFSISVFSKWFLEAFRKYRYLKPKLSFT